MKSPNPLRTIVGILTAIFLAACQNMGGSPYQSNPGVAHPVNARPQYGVVKAIETVPQENQGIAGSNVGVGAIAGAVIGGVVGHQIGSGRGNTVATIAGAAGGAYVGHEIEKRQQSDAYKITVRMDDGSYQAVILNNGTESRIGDRVRLDNGVLQRH
jgi:outer membrane lipoprotein SlyB